MADVAQGGYYDEQQAGYGYDQDANAYDMQQAGYGYDQQQAGYGYDPQQQQGYGQQYAGQYAQRPPTFGERGRSTSVSDVASQMTEQKEFYRYEPLPPRPLPGALLPALVCLPVGGAQQSRTRTHAPRACAPAVPLALPFACASPDAPRAITPAQHDRRDPALDDRLLPALRRRHLADGLLLG